MLNEGGHGSASGDKRSLEIDLPAVLARLDDGDPRVVREGIDTISEHASRNPGAVVPTVPKLRGVLAGEHVDCHADAAYCLAELATESPDDVAPSVETIVSYVADRPTCPATVQLLRCLAFVAEDRPDAVVDHVDELAAEITDGDDSRGEDEGHNKHEKRNEREERNESEAPTAADDAAADDDALEPLAGRMSQWGVALVANLSREYPSEIEPAASVLADAVSARPETVGAPALSALGRLVRATPSASLEFVDDVRPLLRHSNSTVRNNAIGCLGDVAHHNPAVVEEHCPQIARALDSDDPKIRANAAVTLARVAAGTETIDSPADEQLCRCLEDDHASVRANVCVALGYGHVDDSCERLLELASDDPDADVRERASWALSRISC